MTDYDEMAKIYDETMKTAVAALDPAWGVRGYRAHATSDGVAFAATLTHKGVKVGWIEDSGRGGGPRVMFEGGRRAPLAATFADEAQRLFPDDGGAEEELVEAILRRAGK